MVISTQLSWAQHKNSLQFFFLKLDTWEKKNSLTLLVCLKKKNNEWEWGETIRRGTTISKPVNALTQTLNPKQAAHRVMVLPNVMTIINILFQRPSPWEGKWRIFNNILFSEIECSKLINYLGGMCQTCQCTTIYGMFGI
jgi:hypothetical protein